MHILGLHFCDQSQATNMTQHQGLHSSLLSLGSAAQIINHCYISIGDSPQRSFHSDLML